MSYPAPHTRTASGTPSHEREPSSPEGADPREHLVEPPAKGEVLSGQIEVEIEPEHSVIEDDADIELNQTLEQLRARLQPIEHDIQLIKINASTLDPKMRHYHYISEQGDLAPGKLKKAEEKLIQEKEKLIKEESGSTGDGTRSPVIQDTMQMKPLTRTAYLAMRRDKDLYNEAYEEVRPQIRQLKRRHPDIDKDGFVKRIERSNRSVWAKGAALKAAKKYQELIEENNHIVKHLRRTWQDEYYDGGSKKHGNKHTAKLVKMRDEIRSKITDIEARALEGRLASQEEEGNHRQTLDELEKVATQIEAASDPEVAYKELEERLQRNEDFLAERKVKSELDKFKDLSEANKYSQKFSAKEDRLNSLFGLGEAIRSLKEQRQMNEQIELARRYDTEVKELDSDERKLFIELLDFFSYKDLNPNARRADRLHPRASEYAAVLAPLIKDKEGEEKFIGAFLDIRRKFKELQSLLPTSLQKLSPLSSVAKSDSWIMWDIAKQEALKEESYPSSLNPELDYSGSVLLGPEEKDTGEETAKISFMRDVVAWRHLGWEIYVMAKEGKDVSELETLLDDDTKSLLRKTGKNEYGQLTSSEYADLGRRIEVVLRSDRE